jgi:hypothetical protein
VGAYWFTSSTSFANPAVTIARSFSDTFGLLSVILGCSRSKPTMTPFAVAAYIVGAYWFTSSTSFANLAVTIARSFSDTFAGIRPIDAPLFIIAQLLGAVAATALFVYLLPISKTIAQAVVAPPEVSRAQSSIRSTARSVGRRPPTSGRSGTSTTRGSTITSPRSTTLPRPTPR